MLSFKVVNRFRMCGITQNRIISISVRRFMETYIVSFSGLNDIFFSTLWSRMEIEHCISKLSDKFCHLWFIPTSEKVRNEKFWFKNIIKWKLPLFVFYESLFGLFRVQEIQKNSHSHTPSAYEMKMFEKKIQAKKKLRRHIHSHLQWVFILVPECYGQAHLINANNYEGKMF